MEPLRQDGDTEARRRIREDLDTNLLVEAGAGSGKTTSLVGRMVALVERGTAIDAIAAVTFTKKAANELRERFQLELEKRVRDTEQPEQVRARCDLALHEVDRAFLGTIHSFCGRLLRERPLEIGLDPNFSEVAEGEWDELVVASWRRWIEARVRTGDTALADLAALGIEARSLFPAFVKVMQYPDVTFPLGAAPRPDGWNVRRRLEDLLAKASDLAPRSEPEGGWDDLMRLVRRLQFHRRTHDWGELAHLCAALESFSAGTCKVVQKRWAADSEGKAAAKALAEEFVEFCNGEVANLLRAWHEHRYPPVMTFLRRAAEDFARERHATGQLGFEDLLMLAARLLREHPAVRQELGRRYAHLLVDEFQDTDPIQAEVCLLLASDPSEGNDWRAVRPRPGSLFVVGDPKQSIYRFRRADIQIYDLVKKRFEHFGDVLALTKNFRSAHAISTFVNAHFERVFPAESTPQQAVFRMMETQRDDARAAVSYYDFTIGSRATDAAMFAQDAELVAAVVADRIARERRTAGDFLILTTQKEEIAYYARALGRRNIPVATTGAKLPQELELRELLAVLHCLADPENGVLVAAALEGMFFGLAPADLYLARVAGVRFSITHPPGGGDGRAQRGLAQLHEWWKLSQRYAADVVIERILDETGLLFAAASEPLGDARAGALIHLVEVLRAASVVGASGIVEAMERIDVLLGTEAPDAQLRPGRSDAVRVMNLHKAKGLEAPVVFLAAPRKDRTYEVKVHISRSADGAPTGWIVLCNDRGTVAQAPGWAEHAAVEESFEHGEDDRLLYVAATRPKDELIISRCVKQLVKGTSPVASMWRAFDDMLSKHGRRIAPEPLAEGARAECTRTLEDVQSAIAEADARRVAAGAPSFAIATVTESAKSQKEEARTYDLPSGGLGAAWGRAVHRAIEGLGRGRTGENLARYVQAVARDEELDGDHVARLEQLVSAVARSDAWHRLTAAGAPAFELAIMQASPLPGDGARGVSITEGVIDAVVHGDEGWHLVDWKSDDVSDAVWATRLAPYSRQVAAYGAMLEALSGRPARSAVERVR